MTTLARMWMWHDIDARRRDRVYELRSEGTLYVEPEGDPEAHVIRLLETEMHERNIQRVAVNAPGTRIGLLYGKLFRELGLRVLGCREPDTGFPEEPCPYFWVTATTSDGRLLAVRWPSGVEGPEL